MKEKRVVENEAEYFDIKFQTSFLMIYTHSKPLSIIFQFFFHKFCIDLIEHSWS